MEVHSLIAADYAAANQDGKFTLVGAGFTEIKAAKFPCIHPLMFLLVRLKVTKNDTGKNRVVIRLMGEKGPLFKAQFDIDVHDKDDNLRENFINIPCQFVNQKFDAPGDYNFEVEINGKTMSLGLCLKSVPQAGALPQQGG